MPVGSGLVYAVIVALWAGVLVPMWLRRHDAETESRSVDRFSSAMKILSRRPTARTTSRENQLLGVPEASEQSAQSSFIKPTKRSVQLPAPELLISRAAPRTPSQAPRERSVERAGASHNRRRKTLYGLAAVVLFAALGFAVGLFPGWVPLLAFIAGGGFIALMMVQASAQQRQRESQRRAQLRATQRERSVEAPNVRRDRVGSTQTPQIRTDRAATARAQGVRESEQVGWDPTPIPIPRYVTAPPATMVPREIDRRHEGGWSAQGMLDHVAETRAAEVEDLRELDAPVAEDVWSRATAGAPDRDAIFDREMFAADFDSTTAEQLVEEDARRYSPRRRAVNE